MAADCKSAAPCELRRFESSPVHQDFCVPLNRKLLIALALYALLAVMVWQTMDAGRGRSLVWLLLGFFAMRSIVHWRRES